MIKIGRIDNSLKEKFYEKALPFYVEFLKQIYNDEDYKTLFNYLDFKINGKVNYNENQMKKLLIGEREKLDEIIKIVGSKHNNEYANNCYKRFSNTDMMRSWAKDINVISCPYCNLNYVNSSFDNSTRSEFDHYYPKSLFPYLCISLYNLVPCCHDCNQKKGDLDTYSNLFLYPFSEEFGEKIIFDIDVIKGSSITNNGNPEVFHRIGINIKDISNRPLPKSVDNEVSILKIKEKYLAKSFDISTMYNRVIKYNSIYRKSIFKLKIFQRFTPDPYAFCGVVNKENWILTTMAKINFDIFHKFKQ